MLLIAEISSFFTDNLLKRLLGSPPLTKLSVSEFEKVVLDKLLSVLEKNFCRLLLDNPPANQDLDTLWQQFNEIVTKEEPVTRDGYRADLIIDLRDAIYVFEVKKAVSPSGELGPEVVDPSRNLQKAIKDERGKVSILVFISPKGAPKYIAKLLNEASGAVGVSSDSEVLDDISIQIIREWLADTFKVTYDPAQLYRIDEKALKNLKVVQRDEKQVVNWVSSQGLSREEIAEKLGRDLAWVDKVWENAVQKLFRTKSNILPD